MVYPYSGDSLKWRAPFKWIDFSIPEMRRLKGYAQYLSNKDQISSFLKNVQIVIGDPN